MTSLYDINLIPIFPKDFSKENEEIKDLIIYLNEINLSFDSINKLCKSILKVNDQYYNEILSTLKNLNSDFMTYGREIESLITDIILVFYKGFNNLMEKSSECFKELNFDEIIKKCFEPPENISNKINNLNEKCNVLSNQRIQYKNFENQENQLLKRLESSYQELINFDKNGKDIYNFGLKEKIMNSLYENDKLYEDNKKERLKIYSDCKNLELQINLEIKEYFVYIINIFQMTFKNFGEKINSLMNNYHQKITNILTDKITQLTESLNLFNDREENPPKEFNIEKDWVKTNFISNEIPKEFNEITQKHLNKVSYEKKILKIALSTFKSLIQIYDNFNSTFNKELKNISNLLNVQSSVPNSFLNQIFIFLKNLFELHLKKNQERVKKINTHLISPLSNYNENLSNIEDKLSDKLNKFNKEYSNFKSLNNKILADKEKLDNEFNKMKEDLEKDPSKFSEFEKKFLSIKSEIDKCQERLYESFNKSKPLISEYNENVIKQYINKTLNLGKTQLENIKNKYDEYISNEKKIYESFDENYSNKYTFSQDKTKINSYIIELLKLFSKKYSIEFPDNFLYSEEKKINDLESVYLFNTEETIINNYLNISNIIPQVELKKLKEEIDLVTSNNMEINYKNILKSKNKGKFYEDIFIIESDEKLLENFSCTLKEKVMLQGTLYVTNIKLVFYSSFNQLSNIGKTLIIIPNIDVLFIDKKDNNSIELKTEKQDFLFGSFLYIGSCYDLLNKTLFNEYSELKDNKNNLNKNNNFHKIFSSNNLSIKNNNFDKSFFQLSHIKSCQSLHKNLLEEDVNESNKELPKFIDELKQLNKNNLNEFFKNNKREIIEDFKYTLDIGNISLPIIFNLIYNHNINLPFFENKSYLVKLAEQRQDYYLDLIQRGNYEKIPKYYITNSIEDLKNFPNEGINVNLNKKITYKTKYIHPIIKKRFGGPSKLDVEDETNIYIISPFCFIVEISSYLSGFMLIDTYVSTLRYIYTTKLSVKNNNFNFKTKLKINLSIEFIKDTWFKSKIKSDGISDNNELIKDVFLPLVKIIFENTINNKEEICSFLFNQEQYFKFKKINSLKRKKSIPKNENDNNKNQINEIQENKNEIINVEEYIKKFSEYLNNIDFETLLIISICFFVLILFLIFKYDIAIIIIILFIGFSLLFYKILEIDNDIRALKRELSIIKKNQSDKGNRNKKEE